VREVRDERFLMCFILLKERSRLVRWGREERFFMVLIRLSYKSSSVRVEGRDSIIEMEFWRRQRRVRALNRSKFKEGIEDTRACTQSISEVSRG